MRIRLGSGLWLVNLLIVVLAVTTIFVPSGALRVVLGLPFIVLFPGYVLVLALFPRKEEPGGLERAALSFGVSVIVVPLIGLILNYYTPGGLTLRSTLYSTASFVAAASVIAALRRRRLRRGEGFDLEFQLRRPLLSGRAGDKVLAVILAAAILGAAGTLGYVVAAPRAGEKFTEFYVLGATGKATDYPRELSMGGEGEVVVGIINREGEVVSYRLEVRIDGERANELGPLALGHDEKWQEAVSFTPQKTGDGQKVELLLYKNGENEPYLEPLRLWVKVTEPR